jgi:hypothetical protein
MVVSEILSLYRDGNDLFHTIIKRIYEEWDAELEQWHLKKVELVFEDPATAVERWHGWLVPPTWEFVSEIWAYERRSPED